MANQRDRLYFSGGKLVKAGKKGVLPDPERADAANWHPVSSSNVKAVCWRKDQGLGVWFLGKKQTVYWYDKDYESYVAMMRAESKGKFVNEVLRGSELSGPEAPPK